VAECSDDVAKIRDLAEDVVGSASQIEREDVEFGANVYDVMDRGLVLAGGVDQQARVEVGGRGVCEQLIKVGVTNAGDGLALVFDIADEDTAAAFPPGDVGAESNAMVFVEVKRWRALGK
jgi:hypothetical protein